MDPPWRALPGVFGERNVVSKETSGRAGGCMHFTEIALPLTPALKLILVAGDVVRRRCACVADEWIDNG